MEPTLVGVVIDSSALVAAERTNLSTANIIKKIRGVIGDVPIMMSSLTVAEVAHGIYRANTPERALQRRRFVDELKAHIPIHPVTEATAEIVARIGAEQASKGINLPLADLIIGACALELGFAVGTSNPRDFSRIPGLGGRVTVNVGEPSLTARLQPNQTGVYYSHRQGGQTYVP